MIHYLIGVDGGGTGTRVRLARADGSLLAQGQAGPSGLAHGIDAAWQAIEQAIGQAFGAAGLAPAPMAERAIGLGLAGVHNRAWADQFRAADPGYARLVLSTDAYTTLLGAHGGQPGAIIALGTGSVGEVLQPDGVQREVGGWGFPAGDEASGAWIGLQAINYLQQVLDGRRPASALAQALDAACGGGRDAVQAWLARANQTAYASLAPLVLAHAADNAAARAILERAGAEVQRMANALDPDARLPLALCGGLAAPLRPYLPPALAARARDPLGDAAAGALQMIRAAV
ncbi:BadF/BadG/BcrA/BcrD ATPase family protein [Massilia sp. TS11]|uniref:BadF/BadG/BcrA/BcrD ATPase family protein n=1 Tax=Massilia sp. TS11 TaxID=2908003 RepID=UPI001EDA1BD6|nr:BadF/BadG/BcrA/BcrD ATPase family protein [Massilia sp. TS11]MCG2585659.1 ATPase [Massilia sp. TS11]